MTEFELILDAIRKTWAKFAPPAVEDAPEPAADAGDEVKGHD